MKSINYFISLSAIVLFLFSGNISFSQSTAEVKIKTSAQCEMCKKRIEKGLAKEKGVTKSNLDVDTKTATVNYDPTITNPDKIRKAIAGIGYDADSVKAVPASYQKLPSCCKKDGMK